MKTRFLTATIIGMVSFYLACPAWALKGEPYIHDPSTIVECDGKYYTFGTGSGGLISEDGWTWHSGAVRPGGGVAPDTIKIGDRYLVTYADGGGGEHSFRVHTMWTKTLDPGSPDFGFVDNTVVLTTTIEDDCDSIDSAFLLDPTTGRLWCTYGTYFGNIQIIELDPKTGKRVEGNEPKDIAIDCEATAMMYRDGWYYLLGTHGTCCTGATATYNIRVGRSRNVTGPFVDSLGMDMLRGGGRLVVAANNRKIGPGHFGLIDLGDDVQKFSCHYEADMDDPGHFGVLGIRTLLWEDGWPIAGDEFNGGTFEIESKGTGYALELGVDPVDHQGGGGRGMGMGRGRGGRGGGGNAAPATPIPDQDVAQVAPTWPSGDLEIRLGDYMMQAHQKWIITPVPDAGGYFGSPYFKITIVGTDRTLAKSQDDELVAVPSYTGAPEQLWQIDQLIDGSYRILSTVESDTLGPVAITAVGVSTPSLTKFDAKSDRGRWRFKKP